MKFRLAAFFIFFAINVVAAGAQTTTATPQPRAPRNPPTRPNTSVRDANAVFDQLRSLEIPHKQESAIKGSPLEQIVQSVYRKPTKEELRLLTPPPHYLEKYAQFLRQPDTGIIKLNDESACAQKAAVVVANEECLRFTMPGAGTAYSFRAETYRAPHLADLILAKDVLKTDGVLQQGILVNLGDVPIEDVTLQTKGLKFLNDFQPVADVEALKDADRRLSEGVRADGFLYRFGFYISDQTTFALRSIAYRGKVMRSFNGVTYNELNFDKRKDVIVVLRVVELDPQGHATILWKILQNKEAPSLKNEQSK
jgi:hypothetical protein